MLKFKKISILLLEVLVFSVIFTIDARADMFETLSNKTIEFAKGLRNLAYVLSSFGLVMFTFLAIGGKINFKHLSYIAICLFFLSGVGSLIDYVTDDKTLVLESRFGDTYTKAACKSSICR